MERRKGEIKKEKILWTAAKIFSEHGYSATTLTAIAEAVGTHAGSLYYHFKSKDDITRTVLKMSMTTISDRVVDELKGLSSEASPIQKLQIGIKTHLSVILSSDPYLPAYNRIVNEVPKEMRAETAEHARAYGHMFHDIIVRGQELGEIRSDLDPVLIRMFLFGSITWTQLWFKPDGTHGVGEIAQEICEIFLSGIRTHRFDTSNAAAIDVAAENMRLRKAVLDLTLERLALQQSLKGLPPTHL